MQSRSRDGLAAKGLRLTKKRGLLFRTAAGNRAHAFLHAFTAVKRLGMRGILALPVTPQALSRDGYAKFKSAAILALVCFSWLKHAPSFNPCEAHAYVPCCVAHDWLVREC